MNNYPSWSRVYAQERAKAGLEKAQVVASKSVSYMGGKGMINLK